MLRKSGVTIAAFIAVLAGPVSASADTLTAPYNLGPFGDVAYWDHQAAFDVYCDSQGNTAVCFDVDPTSPDPKHHTEPKVHVVVKDSSGAPVPAHVAFYSSAGGACTNPGDYTQAAQQFCNASQTSLICGTGDVGVPAGMYWMVVSPAATGVDVSGPYVGIPPASVEEEPCGYTDTTANGTITVSGAAVHPFAPGTHPTTPGTHPTTPGIVFWI